VVQRAKLQVLDTLTSVFAAAQTRAGGIACHALDPVDGPGTARVVANGVSVSVNTAAFVNTQMSALPDLGSNLYFSQSFGGLAVFGAMALAENARASGAQLLLAVITGYEVGARIALSFPPTVAVSGPLGGRRGILTPATSWVSLGAAAANAKMLSLDAARTAHALALTAASSPPQTSTRWSKRNEVPMAKYGLFGSVASSALSGALLARSGFTGDLEILEDVDGFHNAMRSECADPGAMTRELGERWLMRDVGFKRYPSGTLNQQAIHTVVGLMREHRVGPDDIRAVRVRRAIAASDLFASATPANDVAAQFSLPFAVAAAMLGVPLREWHARSSDVELLALAARVRLVEDQEALNELADLAPAAKRSPWSLRSHVRIETDSEVFERWSDYGDVSAREVEQKFRHYCEPVLPQAQVDAVVEFVARLDRISDIRHLTDLFEQTTARGPAQD
jgi:2-methylcitrate dehydratase PrpD